MENAKDNLTITIDKNGLIDPLNRTLTEVTNAVYIGLINLEALKEIPEHIFAENNFNVHAPYGPPLTLEERKEIYRDWLIKKGFEDIIRAITNMLVEVCQLLDKYEELKSMTQHITFAELQEFILKRDDSVTKKAFPELLKQIEPYLFEKLTHENEIKSINRIRRCLVHRNGIVSSVDFFTGEATLKLHWVLMKAFYEQDGTRTEIREMTLVKGLGEFKVELEKYTKEFLENEKIQISYQVFNEIVLTAFLFGRDLISKLGFEKVSDKAF